MSGALVNFVGTGNQINITNNLCSAFTCNNVNGIQVARGTTPLVNISITNPIKNLAGGTITLSPNAAAIFVDGTASQVTISGQ